MLMSTYLKLLIVFPFGFVYQFIESTNCVLPNRYETISVVYLDMGFSTCPVKACAADMTRPFMSSNIYYIVALFQTLSVNVIRFLCSIGSGSAIFS